MLEIVQRQREFDQQRYEIHIWVEFGVWGVEMRVDPGVGGVPFALERPSLARSLIPPIYPIAPLFHPLWRIPQSTKRARNVITLIAIVFKLSTSTNSRERGLFQLTDELWIYSPVFIETQTVHLEIFSKTFY